MSLQRVLSQVSRAAIIPTLSRVRIHYGQGGSEPTTIRLFDEESSDSVRAA